jgi:hypothetical protein
MARDYSETVTVSTTKVHEMKAAKFGRRTYLLIDNVSANTVKFDHSVAPSDFNGIPLAAGVRYEREQNAPQSTLFIKGTSAADQVINVAQGFED